MQVLSEVDCSKPTGTVEEGQAVSVSWTLGAALTALLGWSGQYLA